MEKSKVICPKCKGNNLTLIELWKNHEITWEQRDGEFDVNDGVLNEGNPYKMEAQCKCGHGWTLRGIFQIYSVIKE